jgi:ElaB/YqjD/DUF883 family membrane-anchored ribosome-binding protein
MPTETPEVIEQQIAATQESLNSKIVELEDRTVGTVREAIGGVTDALGSVTGTIGSVTDTVNQIRGMANVETITEVVQNTIKAIPIKETVRSQPWASVGGAVLVGFITGVFAFRGPRPASPAGKAVAGVPPKPSPLDGLFDTLSERLGGELRKTTDQVMAAVGNKVSEQLTGLLRPAEAKPNATPNRNGMVG